ncbi:MAG: glycosyltransferase family 4 protein [Spirochaetota bacterium]
MHILLISDTYKLIDGVSMHVAQEERYFKSRGHRVTVISTSTQYTTNYYVKRFKPHYQSFDAQPRYLVKRLQHEGPFDVIYSQCLQPQGVYFTIYLSALFNLPIVSRFHSYVPDYIEYAYPQGASRMVKTLFRHMLLTYMKESFKYPQKVVLNVPNNKLTDFLFNMLKIPEEKIWVNHIPVEQQEERSDFPEMFGDRTARWKFFTVGRVSQEKNLPYLVGLWNNKLAAAFPNAVWTIGGKGPYFEQMQEAVEYKDRVRFLGALPHEEVLKQMKRSDLLLHSSLSETFGLVIAEAKSTGLPIVALHDNAGVSAQFDSGKTGGFLVHSEDEFVERIGMLLDDGELYRNISANSQKDIRTNYSTREYDKLLDLFTTLKDTHLSTQKKISMRFLADSMRVLTWYIPRHVLRVYEQTE